MFETENKILYMMEYDKNCYNLLCVNIVDSGTLRSITFTFLPHNNLYSYNDTRRQAVVKANSQSSENGRTLTLVISKSVNRFC